MKFAIRFRIKRGGRRWKVTWDNGRLKGDSTVKALVQQHMATYSTVPFRCGAVGPEKRGNPIPDPLHFLTVCQETFINVLLEGDTPVFKKTNKIV